MASFAYKARDKDGQLHEGEYEAPSLESVAERLQSQKLIPISIKVIAEHKRVKFDWKKYLPREKIPLSDMIIFCRQMHALSRSGIPIMRAVLGLAETSHNIKLTSILNAVGRDLSRGNTLSQSLNNYEKDFSPLFISMITVGESTGNLDDAFKQLVGHLEMERNTRQKVKAALRYPIMVISAIVVALVVVNLLVIPSFASVFSRLGSELPFATQILLGMSNFFVNFWWLIFILLITLIGSFVYYIHTIKGSKDWDRWKLRIPIIGPLLKQIALSRFTRTFAMLFKAGVPILQALDMSAESVGNQFIGRHIHGMRQGIERGDSLSRTAIATEMFPPLIIQMISVGEESGAVDSLLMDVSEFYDEETDYRVQSISSAIEPILLVFMGGMVLVLALGIFLPMWDLGAGAR